MNRIRYGTRALWLLAVATLVGCGQTHVGDPWVSGEQFADERQRGDDLADVLRQRLRTVQQDR